MKWDQIAFNACVKWLGKAADKLNPEVKGGMDYIKLNVILFCILLPAVLTASLLLNCCLLMR